MYCEYCGRELKKEQNYCSYCGAAVEKQPETQRVPDVPSRRKGGMIFAIGVITLFAAIFILAGLWYGNGQDAGRQIELGRKYLEELDYEQAVAAFEQALLIDPKNPEIYLDLAKAYIGTDDMEQALEILEEGCALTWDARLEEEIKVIEEKKDISPSTLIGPQNTEEDGISEDTDSLLESYAQQETYLYGNDYDGYIKNCSEWAYDCDYSEIPMENIAYHIADYDGDGKNELLIIGLTDSYYLILRMYEVEMGGVIFTDEISLEQYNISVMVDMWGNIACYTYGMDEICIGIEDWGNNELLANGEKHIFLSLSYKKNNFCVNGCADYNISYEISDESIDEIYMNTLAKLGIHAPLDELLSGKRTVRDYIKNVEMIVDIETVCETDYEKINQWSENHDNRLHISHIYFGNSEKRRSMVAASETPEEPESMTVDEAYQVLETYYLSTYSGMPENVYFEGKGEYGYCFWGYVDVDDGNGEGHSATVFRIAVDPVTGRLYDVNWCEYLN